MTEDLDLPPVVAAPALTRRQSSGMSLVPVRAADLGSDDISTALLALLATDHVPAPVRGYRHQRSQLQFMGGLFAAAVALLLLIDVPTYLKNLAHGPYPLVATDVAAFGQGARGYLQQPKRWVVAELGKPLDPISTGKADRGVYKFLLQNAMATTDDEMFAKVRVHARGAAEDDDRFLLVRYPGPTHPLLDKTPTHIKVDELKASTLRCVTNRMEKGELDAPTVEELKEWSKQVLVDRVAGYMSSNVQRMNAVALPQCGVVVGFLTDFPLDFQPPGYLPFMLDAEDPYEHTFTNLVCVLALYFALRTVWLLVAVLRTWNALVSDTEVKISPALRRELRWMLALATGDASYRWQKQSSQVYHDVLQWLFAELHEARGVRRMGHKSGVFVVSLASLDVNKIVTDAKMRGAGTHLDRSSHVLVLVDDTMLATFRQWKAMMFPSAQDANPVNFDQVHRALIRQVLASNGQQGGTKGAHDNRWTAGTRVTSGQVLPIRIFPLEGVCMCRGNEVFFVPEKFPGMATVKDPLFGLRKVTLSLRNLSIKSDFPKQAAKADETDEELEVTKLVHGWLIAALTRFDPAFTERRAAFKEEFLRMEDQERQRIEDEKIEREMTAAETNEMTARLAQNIVQGNYTDIFNEQPSDPKAIVRLVRSAKILTEDSPQVQGSTNSDQPEECPICMGFYEAGDAVVSLPCPAKHTFHAQCMRSWLERHNQCPLCRAEVAEVMHFDEQNLTKFILGAMLGVGHEEA